MCCKLCLKKKPLKNSHIISEFFYKPVYDEKHCLNELSNDTNTPNQNYKQKGLREYLLCGDCETLLSLSEKYVNEVLYGGIQIKILQEGNPLILGDIDYVKFKHFQLSILWRASVATQDYFNQVKLGVHEEKIRKMVLNKDVGRAYEYGCAMFAIVTETFQPKGKIEVVDGLIITPVAKKIHGHQFYRFVFGGLMWAFIVSNHSKSFPYQEYLLSEGGVLRIP